LYNKNWIRKGYSGSGSYYGKIVPDLTETGSGDPQGCFVHLSVEESLELVSKFEGSTHHPPSTKHASGHMKLEPTVLNSFMEGHNRFLNQFVAVLRIRDVYPGSGIRIFRPGSRIKGKKPSGSRIQIRVKEFKYRYF
jgi:hypothetical protein